VGTWEQWCLHVHHFCLDLRHGEGRDGSSPRLGWPGPETLGASANFLYPDTLSLQNYGIERQQSPYDLGSTRRLWPVQPKLDHTSIQEVQRVRTTACGHESIGHQIDTATKIETDDLLTTPLPFPSASSAPPPSSRHPAPQAERRLTLVPFATLLLPLLMPSCSLHLSFRRGVERLCYFDGDSKILSVAAARRGQEESDLTCHGLDPMLHVGSRAICHLTTSARSKVPHTNE
jgi:hypothetical protein